MTKITCIVNSYFVISLADNIIGIRISQRTDIYISESDITESMCCESKGNYSHICINNILTTAVKNIV